MLNNFQVLIIGGGNAGLGLATQLLIKKSNIKIFFKALNKNHILPTRYFVDLNAEQQNLIVIVPAT